MSNKKPLIKTNIKFSDGLEGVKGRLYGFVTKQQGSWRGCRASEEKKKIVFVDPLIAGSIIPNMLYRCTLIPMQSNQGFITIHAQLVTFDACVVTEYDENAEVFIVTVKFGNQKVTYNPSRTDAANDIQVIADKLRKRLDLKNAIVVANDFTDSACLVKRLYTQSHDSKTIVS